MKTCRKCGCKIVDGVNGCTMAGDVCFTCKPWNYRPVPSWQSSIIDGGCGSDGDAADYWEGQILDRQDRYFDD